MELSDLYPSLSPEERKAAEYNLGEYFKIALDIAQEDSGAIPQDPEGQDDPRSAS